MAIEDELFDLASNILTPEEKIRFLAYRVQVLTKENEDLEDRVGKLEKTFHMGAGILLVIPVIGSAVGVVIAFGQKIFKPWMTQ